MAMPNYFIKDGYIDNDEASSYDNCANEQRFWTEERLRMASIYQYHVYDFARKLVKRESFTSVADVGCGPAIKTKNAFSNLVKEIYLYDQESIKEIAEQQLPKAKFTAIDFENCKTITDCRFDLIICSDVLEHLHNPIPCIELCKSLADPQSYILFSTPERDRLRGRGCTTSPHPQHVREWNSDEFKSLLKSCGLIVESEHLFPAKKLSRLERLLRILCLNLVNAKNWKSCQLKVCRI